MARRVRVEADNILLPDGGTYDTGDEVTLTDEEFDELSASALGDEVTDLGTSATSEIRPLGSPSATAAAAAPATKTIRVNVEGTVYRIPLYAD